MAVPPWVPMLLGKEGLARRQLVAKATLRVVCGIEVLLGTSVSRCAEVKQFPAVICARHITLSLYGVAIRKTAKHCDRKLDSKLRWVVTVALW